MKTASFIFDLQKIAPAITFLPKDFMTMLKKGQQVACYLVACANKESITFVSPTFKQLTGYEPQEFQRGGSSFWFSLIHPADLPIITKILSEAHLKLSAPEFSRSLPPPLVLEYRIKKADRQWIWLQESKWIIEFTPDGIKDKILCLIENITKKKEREEAQIKDLLEREKSSHTLLKTALEYRDMSQKELSDTDSFKLKNGAKLTNREKEVLALLAEGKSTKEIATQLFITVNTVETHRRHLLNKFGVKNSVELMAQASKKF